MKSDVVFGLDKAPWPAFLVTTGVCAIRFANRAARVDFATTLDMGMTLGSMWCKDNGAEPDQFLGAAVEADLPLVPIKLTGDGGKILTYMASACPFADDGESFFVLQLFPVPEGVATKSPVAAAPVADTGQAQRQKLDCALQLARTVALDFNNALTSILGHTSLILSKLEPTNPWRRSLMEVEKSASKAAEIAYDLAAFSRQEKETRVQQAGNVNVLLQRNVDALQANQTEKQVNWSLQLERRLYAAKFDEAKMHQALLKIMENAIESIGSHGRIILTTKNLDLTQPTQDRNVQLAAGAYVCVEIADSGSGIEPEVLPRIFEPFFTTKRGGKHRGLGLAFVYGIITNHGGGVAVSSQPGTGTSVRVYLPADKKFVKDNGIHTNDLTGDQTILMVDDEDLLLTMGQAILSTYGYRVLTANSGSKAIQLLSQPDVHVDLIITDLVMPGMSGREFVEHAHLVAPNSRILCSSGYVRPTNEELEESTYLQKPFTTQELLLKVKHALAPAESLETAPVD